MHPSGTSRLRKPVRVQRSNRPFRHWVQSPTSGPQSALLGRSCCARLGDIANSALARMPKTMPVTAVAVDFNMIISSQSHKVHRRPGKQLA
jgi:hypothetical protein